MATRTQIIGVTQKTYPQVWPAYNAAQVAEGDKFPVLLRELVAGLPAVPRKPGRPSLAVADAIFSATYKVYSTFSGRRFMSDLRWAHNQGFISHLPCYNTIFNVFQNDEITDTLTCLIERSASPVEPFEHTFAIDSSTFPATRLSPPSIHVKRPGRKPKKEFGQHDWVKAHLAAGVLTNVVTAVVIRDRNASDSKQFPSLLKTTSKTFLVEEVVADKAYSGKTNTRLVAEMGAVPYLLYKGNAAGGGGGVWQKMFDEFQVHKEDYLAHYHQRSNVESTFSMLKRKFAEGVRSRTDTAMKNETLCKVLCHNIVVLIHAMYELGIDPVFWPDTPNKPAKASRII